MASAATMTLFEDIFEVTALNPEGKIFERVNRLSATGTTFECDLLLDINCEIYRVDENDRITLVLASTLNLDGTPDDHFSYAATDGISGLSYASGSGVGSCGDGDGGMADVDTGGSGEPSLADNYDYVMHGRVFDIVHQKGAMVSVHASYGGLLMRLTGDQRHLTNIQPDMRLYLLLKKDY